MNGANTVQNTGKTSNQKRLPVAPALCRFAQIFEEHGKKAYLAGGAVRDILLKKKACDWDIATDASPQEVMAMFKTVIPTGIKHGTVTVLYKGASIEVTTFRTEADYRDGRRPERVEFAATIEEDLSRRDFTMNAMALSLPDGRLVDPFGGALDIKNQIIRCVGSPPERFSEDGLRPLRALRFASTLGFSLEAALLDAIKQCLDVTAMVSMERVQSEFEKMLRSPRPQTALEAMRQTGLLKLLLPELDACVGVLQKGYHRFDVWTHSVLACAYAAAQNMSLEVRLAALLHDIGKPETARLNENGVWTFYNHEKVSAKKSRALLSKLRFDNQTIEKVVHLIEEHMFHYEDEWSDAAVRRFIIRVGEENLEALFALRAADSAGTAGVPPDPRSMQEFLRRIERVREKSSALSIKKLAVNGHDLMAIGVPAGKSVGIILKLLLEAVLEDPALNTREKLLEIAKKTMENKLT
ncbi:MAG: HD domain-containing protein [Spirochaetaceae bacterium]|jgi:putative nucleotidyltransferase with HDIG domain|nr:HD domain-containing protein [Spirochaetaceae bacterium]